MMQYHRERRARATNHSDVDDRACEGSPLIAPVMEQVHFYAQCSVRVMYRGTYLRIVTACSLRLYGEDEWMGG